MKKLALFLSMMMAVSFTACQSQPATKSWSSASPAPESAPQSTSIQAPESSSQPEDKEAPALLYYDEGVKVTTLMSWEPGQQEVEIPFPAYDGLLAVEVREGDTPELLQKRVMEEAEWLLLPQAAELICRELPPRYQ